jgi:predicted DNA-binding transcriptional regulator YafY
MKSTTPIKLERLIRLDEIFRQQLSSRHTASSLGAEVEVTERTIRHDLEFLRDRYHAPIEYTRDERELDSPLFQKGVEKRHERL